MQLLEIRSVKYWSQYLLALAVLLSGSFAHAEIPTILTDTIKQGSGTIDVMQDVTAAELGGSLSDGTLYLGVDLNEDASGLESSTSQGVAIKEMELVLTTTEGTFSFSTFYTNTTAIIKEQGLADANEYHTLFGKTGSSQISSSTEGFDLSTFDDVIEIQDISYTGDILDAQIRVTFLDTDKKFGDNEEFFDYSAGFEDFAILSTTDAQTLDNADIGLAEAPTTVTYTASTPSGGDIAAPSGAPEPPWILLGAIPALLLSRVKRK
ncbi:MAG: hypothetical protein ABF326_07920 [Arenicellales bacterium]|jgi:hypothetical protein